MSQTEVAHSVNGKWSAEKLASLQAAWAKHCQASCSELSDMMRKHDIQEDAVVAIDEAGVECN